MFKKLLFILILINYHFVYAQVSTSSYVIFDEDHEYAQKWTTINENNGCDPATWGSQGINTVKAYDGTKSAEFYYRIPPFATSGCGTTSNQHRYFKFDFSNQIPGTEFTFQGYLYFKSAEAGGSESLTGKLLRFRSPDTGTFHEIVVNSENVDSNTVKVYFTSVNNEVSENFPTGGFNITRNQWEKFKIHIIINTVSTANGTVQAWINGTQVCNETARNLRGSSTNNYAKFWVGVDTQRDTDLNVDWKRYWDKLKLSPKDIITW